MRTMVGQLKSVLMVPVISLVLLFAGCAETMVGGDTGMMKEKGMMKEEGRMMKKESEMMKKEGGMMKEEKGSMEKKQ